MKSLPLLRCADQIVFIVALHSSVTCFSWVIDCMKAAKFFSRMHRNCLSLIFKEGTSKPQI